MSSPFQASPGAYRASPPVDEDLIVGRRFLAWGFIAFLAVVLAGVNLILPTVLNELNDSPLTGLLLGICIAEVNLIALWGVMAPGRWLLRLPWSMALLVVMWYTLAVGARLEGGSAFEMEEALHLGETLLLGYIAAMFPLTIIAAVFNWKLERPEDQEVREQMSIGLLLVVMTLLGVLLAMGRWVLPQTGFRWSLMDPQIFILLGALILFNLLQTTPAIWISFLPPRTALASAIGMMIYAILLTVLEILFISMFLGMPPGFLDIMVVFAAINVGQTATVLLVLCSMRLMGFGLIRKQSGSPFGTVAAGVTQDGAVAAPVSEFSAEVVDQLFKMSGNASDTGTEAAPPVRFDTGAKPPQPTLAETANASHGESPFSVEKTPTPTKEQDSLEVKVAAAMRASGRNNIEIDQLAAPRAPGSDGAHSSVATRNRAAAAFFVFGPLIASAICIPIMFQSTNSAFTFGGLIGWIVGSVASIAIGVAILYRKPGRRG